MTSTEKSKTERPAAFKPVTLRNLKPAPFYFDDTDAMRDRADKGIALKAPVKLTEDQWRRRTPAQWGVLIANEAIALSDVPEADREALEAAEAKENDRLSRVKNLSELEESILNNTAKI